MSALLRKYNLLSLILVLSSVFAFAQEQVRPTGSAGNNEEESVSAAQIPADVSDLGTVTLESLKSSPVYWMCRNRDVVRTIRIEHVGGGCNTFYTKDGLTKVVSQAMGVTSCLNVFGNIRRNLKAASWKCKDISESRLSSSL